MHVSHLELDKAVVRETRPSELIDIRTYMVGKCRFNHGPFQHWIVISCRLYVEPKKKKKKTPGKHLLLQLLNLALRLDFFKYMIGPNPTMFSSIAFHNPGPDRFHLELSHRYQNYI